MKYCPICDERYDEEIIRFCTKDGTPLVDDEQPSFTALPSEGVEGPDDDFGEETVIRRKSVNASDAGLMFDSEGQSERIVIPTTRVPEPQVRPRATQAYYPPPPEPNTAKTVFLTILGTLAVLGFGATVFWFLQKDAPANLNTNINVNLAGQNTNLNTNLGFDSNFNFNASTNFNTNYNTSTNLNTNLRIPTPTPTPKPSPSVSPIASPTAAPSPSPTPRPTVIIRPNTNVGPTPLGTPRTGPRPPTMTGNRPPGNGN